MTQPVEGLCRFCKHMHSDSLSCDAFPARIPDEIRYANLETDTMPYDHRKPYPGDSGIRFEIRDELSKKIDVGLLFSE